ncbi:hypothetical protein ACJ72_04213, partial [Emergomyces africanus]
MKFIQTSIIFSFSMLLMQSMAVPMPDPAAAPEAGDVALAERGFEMPKEVCPQGAIQPPVQQSNKCSTGTPFCCDTIGG